MLAIQGFDLVGISVGPTHWTVLNVKTIGVDGSVYLGRTFLSYGIGIGGAVARSPLPHHQDMRVRIRRFGGLS